MAGNVLAAIERQVFAAIITVVTLATSGGLAFWVWSDRFARSVPAEAELVALSGQVTHAMAQPRSGVVWLDIRQARGSGKALPQVTAVRLYARHPQHVAEALSARSGALAATTWAAPEEVEVAHARQPPTALQLRIGSETLVSYAESRSVREEHAATARANAWLAAAGSIVSLGVLVLFWVQRLRA